MKLPSSRARLPFSKRLGGERMWAEDGARNWDGEGIEYGPEEVGWSTVVQAGPPIAFSSDDRGYE